MHSQTIPSTPGKALAARLRVGGNRAPAYANKVQLRASLENGTVASA